MEDTPLSTDVEASPLVAQQNRAEFMMPEFKKAKDLLDEINALISGYDPALKERAMEILLREAFGVDKNGERSQDERGLQAGQVGPVHYSGAPTLIDYASKWLPRTGADRALLSLYYLKKALGLRSATGRQISKELEESGMQLANISVSMHENVRLHRADSRPLSGKKGTKSVRHEYSITDIGIKYVESRFNLDYRT